MSRIPKGRFLSMLEAANDCPHWKHNCPIDSRTGPTSTQLNGLIYRYDDSHWDLYYPPNEYFDRDIITCLTDYAIKREKLKVQTKPFILKTP